MKLPRDLSGDEVAKRLRRQYGYRVTRTRGSHMTVTLIVGHKSHNVTVPRHRNLRVGTLNEIVGSAAAFLGLSKAEVREALFR